MKTYTFENGYTEQQIKNLSQSILTTVNEYIKTTDGEFWAKSSHYLRTAPSEPHYKEVIAEYPNGKHQQFFANMNNGRAYRVLGSEIY